MLLAEAPQQRLRENRIAELDAAYPDLWEDLQQLRERDLVEYVREERAYYLAPDGFDEAADIYWMRRREAEAEASAADVDAIEVHNARVRRRARRVRVVQRVVIAAVAAVALGVLTSLMFSVAVVRRSVPSVGFSESEEAAMDSVLQRFVDSLEGR